MCECGAGLEEPGQATILQAGALREVEAGQDQGGGGAPPGHWGHRGHHGAPWGEGVQVQGEKGERGGGLERRMEGEGGGAPVRSRCRSSVHLVTRSTTPPLVTFLHLGSGG